MQQRKKLRARDSFSSLLPSSPLSPQVKGCLFSLLTVLLSLSLWSFADQSTPGNWLGIVGAFVGFSFHLIFGAGSYLILAYLAYLSRRAFQGALYPFWKPPLIAFGVFLFSACIIMNLLADSWPFLHSLLEGTLFSKTGRVYWNIHFYLGGTPCQYLYAVIPYLNFKFLLNTLGTGLLFSGLLLTSFLVLAHFDLKPTTALPTFPPAEKEKEPSSSEGFFKKLANLFSRSKSSEEKQEPELDPLPTLPPLPEPAIPPPPAMPSFNISEPLHIPPPPPPFGRDPLERFQDRMELLKYDEPPSPKPHESVQTTINIATPTPAPKATSAPKPTKKAAAPVLTKGEEPLSPSCASYPIPEASILTPAKKTDLSQLKKDLQTKATILQETLRNFNIESKVGQINCGPTITSFEVHPAIGVKVQRIKTLSNDIALNLQASSIRVIAPIPGKAAVGIEIPNPVPQEVSFRELLQTYQKDQRRFNIPMLLGKAVNGDAVMEDLVKMPHCIIAGATGSGKSVCINTIIMSIIMNARPSEVRLLMVDPKRVELSGYTLLPHMLAPVITDPTEACAALKWLVKEMERRYELLKNVGVRNIQAFNKRTKNFELEAQLESSFGFPIPDTLPYYVGIVDELADLMMVAGTDIETPIARIAQMARAIGIHLILATQRPSREVITGLIKANFPTRISFKVASKINSQIILDDVGAETLLGNGDMLYLPPGTSEIKRAQGAYIRDEDIRAVVQSITSKAPPNYITESFLDMEEGIQSVSKSDDDLDTLYETAYDVVTQTGNASTTFLQRKLKIGYARAASIMDQLHAQGVIGAADGSKARKILLKQEQD